MPRSPRPAGPGRPKDPGKRRAILDAAKQLFPRHGYDEVSMDAVAALAGVSKLTVYSHFSDKESLFAAAVSARCEEQLPADAFVLPPAGEAIRPLLCEIGHRCHALVNSEEAVQLYRVMAAQAPNSPKLAQLFFEAGPRRLLSEFEALLVRADAAGSLDVPHPTRAAEYFFCLVKGLCHMQVVIGACAPVATEQARAHVEEVVDLFLKVYQPPGARAP